MALSFTGSALGVVNVTPSDTVNLTKAARALWVGGAGDVSIVCPDGSTAVLVGVPVGVLPIACARVNATGTTATDIVALI